MVKHMIMDRFQRLISLIQDYNLDAILVLDEENLRFLSYNSIFSGRLFVSSKEIILFVSSIDYAMYSHLEGIKVMKIDSFLPESLFHKFFSSYKNDAVGIDSSLTSYELSKNLTCLIPDLCCIPNLLSSLRIIKDDNEISLLKEAADLGTKGYFYVLSQLVLGVSEQEIVTSLKTFWAKNGADGVAFSPIIAFGENSAYPHWRASDRRLESGDLVLIDIGVSWKGYCSDMTRVVLFEKYSEFWNSCYLLVKEAQQKGFDYCVSGRTNKEIHHATKEVFLKKGQEKYFVHGTGHGLGMQVHEAPYISSNADEIVLLEGMVITIEPGLYYPRKGGIRLEDSVVITENGYFNLTNVALTKTIPLI